MDGGSGGVDGGVNRGSGGADGGSGWREQHSNNNHSSVGLGASGGNHTASLQVTEVRGQPMGEDGGV